MSARARTSADVNVIGSQRAMMKVLPPHVHPTRCRFETGLKGALTHSGLSSQLASDLYRIYADLLPPRALGLRPPFQPPPARKAN
jgi:hypothetical protein